MAGLQVRDLEFLDILGPSPKVVELVKTNAHEGAVWYPDNNEFYFSSVRLEGPNGVVRTDVGLIPLSFSGQVQSIGD